MAQRSVVRKDRINKKSIKYDYGIKKWQHASKSQKQIPQPFLTITNKNILLPWHEMWLATVSNPSIEPSNTSWIWSPRLIPKTSRIFTSTYSRSSAAMKSISRSINYTKNLCIILRMSNRKPRWNLGREGEAPSRAKHTFLITAKNCRCGSSHCFQLRFLLFGSLVREYPLIVIAPELHLHNDYKSIDNHKWQRRPCTAKTLITIELGSHER